MLNIFDRIRHRFSALYRRSREQKFRLFQDLAALEPGATILDVGVDVGENNPFENLLEQQLSDTYRIVAVTLGNPAHLRAKYPKVRFVRADGCALPFRDDAFDTMFSNAVIEHVGREANQRRFTEEAVRVARTGFITTPNFWYPIELHTTLPLVHYLPWGVRRYVFRALAGRENEGYMSRIRLLSTRAFRRLFKGLAEVRIIPVRTTFWPETLIAFFTRER